MTLSDAEVERYSRQLVLPEWSGAAQERLKEATVIVVGVGALGSRWPRTSRRPGWGTWAWSTPDVVELSNLHRQPLHFTPDLGLPKAGNAVVKLSALNSEVQVDQYPVRLEETNAEAIVMGADLVVDCTDSFETRYLVNDACCAQGIPLVEAGVLGFDGLVMSIVPGRVRVLPVRVPDRARECALVPRGRRARRDGGRGGLDPGARGAEAPDRRGRPPDRRDPADRGRSDGVHAGGHRAPPRLPGMRPGTGLVTISLMFGLGTLARVARELRHDLTAAQDRDPAARSLGRVEILLTYGGVQALLTHRVAHALHEAGIPLVPYVIANTSKMVTGVEIHPAAQIGDSLFIDHGSGVVIGETAEIGNNVTLYQGVTLGGTGFARGKRHPTVEDDVVVGSGPSCSARSTWDRARRWAPTR